MGTRFLPLSKAVPKPLLPVGEKPMIHHILEEAKLSGIEEVVMVVSSKESPIISYFEKDSKLEETLEERGEVELLASLRAVTNLAEELSLEFVFQKEPKGDGHAILQAKDKVKNEPFAVLFCDDLVFTKEPALKQLLNVFKTSGRPVIGLYRVSEDEVSSFGVVDPEKIAKGVYKVKRVVEKPSPDEAPSDLAVMGKYVLTSDIFEYLENEEAVAEAGKMVEGKGEIVLAEAMAAALKGGKVFYGSLIKGEWLQCGETRSWLKSHCALSLLSSKYKKDLKRFIKEKI